MSPDICPQCGAEVPSGAQACPECGSDEQTGWSDHATSQRLDLPDEDFDYDDFVKREFGADPTNRVKPRGVSWLWWVVAIVLVLLLLGILWL